MNSGSVDVGLSRAGRRNRGLARVHVDAGVERVRGVADVPDGEHRLAARRAQVHRVRHGGRGLLHAATDLQVMAADAGKTLRGKVVIGCYSSLAPTLLTELMAEYGNRHPDVELDFFAGTQQEIHEKLLSGELDLAIAYDLTVPPGLTRKRLREAVPVVVLPADHPLAAQDKVALAELVDEPMILLDVNPSRENTEMMFSAAGLIPWIRFRTTDFEVTQSYTWFCARSPGSGWCSPRPMTMTRSRSSRCAARSKALRSSLW